MRHTLILILLTLQLGARDLIIATIDSNDTEVIINTAIIREAYRSLDRNIFLKYYPPERALLHSNQGEADAELFRLPIIEHTYTNLIRVPVPLGTILFYVMTADSTLNVSSWDEIKKRRVVILRGVKHLQMRTEGMKRTQVPNEAQAFFLLQNQRADIYIGANPKVSLLKANASEIYIHPTPIETLHLYHYLHKKNSSLVKPLEKTLIKMQQTGRIQHIRDSVLDSLPQLE